MQNSEQKKNHNEKLRPTKLRPPKNVTQKENLRSLKLHHDLFQLSHFVKIYRQTHNNHIQVQKEKEKCVICLCYPHNNKLGAVTVV